MKRQDCRMSWSVSGRSSASTSPYWLTGSPIHRKTLRPAMRLEHERPQHDETALAAHGHDGKRRAASPARCAR